MSRLLTVAVDPGGATTGIVVRSGDTLHVWALVERNHLEPTIDPYLSEVCDTIIRARDHARNLALSDDRYGPTTLAVEDINDPTPNMRTISVRGLIDTAQVVGAVAARWAVVRIPPGGHGMNPLGVYPEALRGGREKKGTGKLRHCRAAWDIARHALLEVRTGKARQ